MNTYTTQRILAFRASGHSIRAIAELVGVSRSSVQRIIASNAGDESQHIDDDPAQQHMRRGSLRSAARLPVFATTFIGRRLESAQIRETIGSNRLVSIVGPGGVGKTRLAVHVASQVQRAFDDGVYFVDLASVQSPQHVAQVVLDAIGTIGGERADVPIETVIADHLHGRRVLVLMDNCEQVLESVGTLVHSVLRETSGAQFLVTSRERLGLPDEYVFSLNPLPVTSGAAEEPDAAVALFESRAASVLGGFSVTPENRDAVVRVCEGLDGLPLAIELACARLPVLSVAELAARIEHSLGLLTTGNRGGPSRHRSLSAALDWSRDQCSKSQLLLWERASIFAGEFDLDMAQQVCADAELPEEEVFEALSGLVAKSLLNTRETGAGMRFRMLSTVREHGRSHVGASVEDAVRRRLLFWLRGLAEELTAKWSTAEQMRLGERVRVQRADIRASLDFALASGDPQLVSAGAIMLTEPWFLWALGISLRDHRQWLERFAPRADAGDEQARVQAVLAFVMVLQGDRTAAAKIIDEARAAHPDAATNDFLLHGEGMMAYFSGDFAKAGVLLGLAAEAYAARPPRASLSHALDVHRGMLAVATGDAERGWRLFESVYRVTRAQGEHWMRAYAGFGLSLATVSRGDAPEALNFAREALEDITLFEDSLGTSLIVEILAWAESLLGNHERAATLFGAVSRIWGSFGHMHYGSPHWQDSHAQQMGALEQHLGEARVAALAKQGAAMRVAELIRFALDTEQRHLEGGKPKAGESTLTERERQIAAMVSAGMTNKQIAAGLVLSIRTVEGHVENLLRKLAINRRGEVAGALRDLDIDIEDLAEPLRGEGG